jgi:radical SAM protein with 4Fe4S-binding SPASM domain
VRVVAFCANGDVKGCPSHPREFVVGNIRETPLAEIWGDPTRFAYNTAFDEKRLEGGCARCPFGRICRAGCTSMAYAVTGTIYDNPFCIQRVGDDNGPG